jgi:hypothetical protein
MSIPDKKIRALYVIDKMIRTEASFGRIQRREDLSADGGPLPILLITPPKKKLEKNI